MQLAETGPHSAALLVVLTAVEGLEIGDGQVPAGAGWAKGSTPGHSDYAPYAVLYGPLSETLSGPAGASDDDDQMVFQVTYVGSTREQAAWARDKGRAAVMANTLVVEGRSVSRVALDVALPPVRDDDVEPAVFFAADRYRLWSTPA